MISKKNITILALVLVAAACVTIAAVIYTQKNTSQTPTSEIEEVYNLRHDYLGDASANIHLLNALKLPDIAPFTIEIESSSRPYILHINFSSDLSHDYDRANYERDMETNAIILLALIKNVDEIHYSNINSTNETTENDDIIRKRSDYVEPLGNLKQYGESLDSFRQLIAKMKQLGLDGELCGGAEACDLTPMFIRSQDR